MLQFACVGEYVRLELSWHLSLVCGGFANFPCVRAYLLYTLPLPFDVTSLLCFFMSVSVSTQTM